MKNNKLFKWLYGIFMFLPMLAIGVCCAYVTFNKNAKDSYYGETINEEIETSINYTNLINNQNYIFKNEINNNKTSDYGSNNKLFVENVVNINGFGNNVDLSNTYYIQLYLTTNYNALQFYDNQNNQIYARNMYDIVLEFSFDYLGVQGNTEVLSYYNYFYQIEYNKYSYLDNAFYYAIDKFNECGFNKVDFVSFFDFFNTQNNIYITFVNTYINYMLFVSLAFFIPRVLMWFIGFAYGLTDSYSGRSLW